MLGALEPGQVLRGKYRVERVIGAGGMGTVILATHLKMSQLVAIKVLSPEAQRGADVMLRFAREARAASKLRSEHAVRILDVDESDDGEPFLVMEYLEGTDLQQHLAAKGPLAIEDAVDYVLQACEGIAEAHAAGIVHRDLKPANLFLTRRADGSPLVKILDFGISKALEIEAPGQQLVTAPTSVMGSPSYMSPEQIRNAATVDARSDVWSLGVVLHQLLTGALPFEATSIAALAARIAADPPVALRKARPDAPPALESVLLRCLEKDVGSRFADMAELARSLAPFAPAGSAGALRVARTAQTRRAAEAPDATPANTSAARSGSTPPLSSSPPARDAAVIATASLHGAEPKPGALEKALATEYASTLGHESAAPPPPAARKRNGWQLAVAGIGVAALIALVALKLGGGASLGDEGRAPRAPEIAPESGLASASSASSAVASVASVGPSIPSSIAAVGAPDAGLATSLVLPARSAPSPPIAPARRDGPKPKNPMEIDFR